MNCGERKIYSIIEKPKTIINMIVGQCKNVKNEIKFTFSDLHKQNKQFLRFLRTMVLAVYVCLTSNEEENKSVEYRQTEYLMFNEGCSWLGCWCFIKNS